MPPARRFSSSSAPDALRDRPVATQGFDLCAPTCIAGVRGDAARAPLQRPCRDRARARRARSRLHSGLVQRATARVHGRCRCAQRWLSPSHPLAGSRPLASAMRLSVPALTARLVPSWRRSAPNETPARQGAAGARPAVACLPPHRFEGSMKPGLCRSPHNAVPSTSSGLDLRSFVVPGAAVCGRLL